MGRRGSVREGRAAFGSRVERGKRLCSWRFSASPERRSTLGFIAIDQLLISKSLSWEMKLQQESRLLQCRLDKKARNTTSKVG